MTHCVMKLEEPSYWNSFIIETISQVLLFVCLSCVAAMLSCYIKQNTPVPSHYAVCKVSIDTSEHLFKKSLLWVHVINR